MLMLGWVGGVLFAALLMRANDPSFLLGPSDEWRSPQHLLFWVYARRWPNRHEERFLRGGIRPKKPIAVHPLAFPAATLGATIVSKDPYTRAGIARSAPTSEPRENSLCRRISMGRHYWEGRKITSCYYLPDKLMYRLGLENELMAVDVDYRDLSNEDLLRSMYQPPSLYRPSNAVDLRFGD